MTSGAVYDHVVYQAPPTSTGQVFDAIVETTTAGSGPSFDHDAVNGPPGSSTGPASDDWLSPTASTSTGPQFDHRVLGLVTPDWNHGPIHDSWPAPSSTSNTGPVLEGAVSKIPDPIDLNNPDQEDVVQERNRIVPQLVEFTSPDAFRLERDLEGKIRGFKF